MNTIDWRRVGALIACILISGAFWWGVYEIAKECLG
jgi:hypothetical protein